MPTSPTNPDERPKIWDFDHETLAKAYIDYNKLPAADRSRLRFGQYFLHRFKIKSLISWPALFYEENPLRAYEMLSDLATSVRHKN